jgi:hypothetical protein
MVIEILIIIYFFINTFFAGYVFAGRTEWYILLLALTVGTPIVLYLSLEMFFSWIADTLNEQFQISFWWSYLFTHGWKKCDPIKLKNLNIRISKTKTSNSMKDKIFRHCVKLINKANNFDPSTPLAPSDEK